MVFALQEVREHLGEDKRRPGVKPISEAVPQGAGQGQRLSFAFALLCFCQSIPLHLICFSFLVTSIFLAVSAQSVGIITTSLKTE